MFLIVDSNIKIILNEISFGVNNFLKLNILLNKVMENPGLGAGVFLRQWLACAG